MQRGGAKRLATSPAKGAAPPRPTRPRPARPAAVLAPADLKTSRRPERPAPRALTAAAPGQGGLTAALVAALRSWERQAPGDIKVQDLAKATIAHAVQVRAPVSRIAFLASASTRPGLLTPARARQPAARDLNLPAERNAPCRRPRRGF
jgi:hypothetical protein